MYILGITVLGHDLSMTLVDEEGQVVCVAEEERYSGRKGGNFVFHPLRVLSVLSEYGVAPEQVETIAVAGRPEFWTANQANTLSYSPAARLLHQEAWLKVLVTCLPKVEEVVRVKHHLAHAASAFLVDDWDEATIITADGFGDGDVATISRGCGNRIELLATEAFPHSVSYLYRAFATWLGLRGHEREGKLMALSSLGKPEFLGSLRARFTVPGDSSFRIAPLLAEATCQADVWAQEIAKVLGPGRTPDQAIQEYHCNMAASIQALFENAIGEMFYRARGLTSATRCCCAGGAFLNSVANGKLREGGLFREMFVQPVSSDGGLSLGAALLVARAKDLPPWRMRDVFLGSDLNLSEVPAAAEKLDLAVERPEDLVGHVAEHLLAGRVVGWCQGRMEVGPRALGHRSLLVAPSPPSRAARLNEVKRREPWRPFAPVMLEEESPRLIGKSVDSPFMTFVFQVQMPSLIPAATHVDGSARVQTLSGGSELLLGELLRRMKERNGVGALVNTSLNVRGKPIARTVGDCLRFLTQSEADEVVIGPYVVSRRSRVSVELSETLCPPGLPARYVLTVFDPDGQLSALADVLRNRATQEVAVQPLDILKTCNGPLSAVRVNGSQLPWVVLIPWYFEVCREMLPRLMEQVRRAAEELSSVFLVDPAGRTKEASQIVAAAGHARIEESSFTDVELHFLNYVRRLDGKDHATTSTEWRGLSC